MTDIQGWEQQQGGLWLKVSPYDRNDAEHKDDALQVMRHSLETIARKHGASFSEKGFRNNELAISSGDIWVDLYLAKWEACERKPLCVGAAFGWDTYGFMPDGQLVRSVYTEDVCLLTSRMRELVGTKPKDKSFPDEGLAECFERISLNRMKADGVAYRFGEVAPDNTAMLRQLGDNGASMGFGPDSAVLEYQQFPADLLDKFPMDVRVAHISRDGIRNERNFIARWQEGTHDIRFIVTRGRSTAVGSPRADIRPWHNGNLPDQAILECVIASALKTIKQEVEDRRWDNQNWISPSPSLPLGETKPRIFKALYNAAGDELRTHAANRPATFDRPVPDAHIFVQDDPTLMNGLIAAGAQRRLFGNRPMIPGTNVLV